MAQQRPGLDLSKLSSADKLILGGAGGYFIWSFLPFWYHFGAGPISSNLGGWHGITLFPALLSLLALAWTGARVAGVTANVKVNFPIAYIDLGLAGLAILFTLLGLVSKPAFYGISWGLFVAIILALVWGYGAWMRYQEPAASGGPPPAGPPPPPASGGGGGFTA